MPDWLTVTSAVIDGRACRTRAAFFTEVARVLPLPPYFGGNWDAFADVLRDLPRPLPLVVTHAHTLLAEEDDHHLATLLLILHRADATLTLCTTPTEEPHLRTRLATEH